MISYAKDHEDVVLWRALGDNVLGFYVDVGAGSPTTGSVTRHFYEAGWCGVNVEPSAGFARELRAARTRDFNFEVAAGSQTGERILYRVREDPMLSTLDLALATQYRRAGCSVEEIRVPVRTLDEVLDEVDPDRIDFLRIHVDGAEREVLSGLNLWRWRPRVVLLQGVQRTASSARLADFEDCLLSTGYLFASTDGLNRYYVRSEDKQLIPRLAPANSDDEFITERERSLEDEISSLRQHKRRLEADLQLKTPDIGTDGASGAPTAIATPVGRVLSQRIELDRIAVLTGPATGAELLTAALCELLDVPEIRAPHPADVGWSALPDRAVVELCWPRSEELSRRLNAHGFFRIAIARHPIEQLLAILRRAQSDHSTHRWLNGNEGVDDLLWGSTPSSPAFVEWGEGARGRALLGVSASWWLDPATIHVRYDELASDPKSVASSALAYAGLDAPAPPTFLAEMDPPEEATRKRGADEITGGWEKYVSADVASRLIDAHAEIIATLGFPRPVLAQLPDATTVEASWRADG